MAIRQCKECGNQVSTTAEACPKCGAVLKKKSGCLAKIGIGFLILVAFSVIISLMKGEKDKSPSSPASSSTSSPPSAKQKAEIKIYQERETVNIGYTSYAVWGSWWSDKLSDNKFLNKKPDADFLFIDVAVRNNDTKPRSIAPFKLIDERGAEYETSSKGYAVKDSIGVLTSLNPDVQKQGLLVFDVPRRTNYKLKISGGYWSGENALIQLSPETKRP